MGNKISKNNNNLLQASLDGDTKQVIKLKYHLMLNNILYK